MLKNTPQFKKHHKIAVIGAGPAGIHMASLLKKRGYDNVTILEKTNRIGGKSYTIHKDRVPYEMGTCFLHNGYHRIKHLAKSYGLREDIHPEGRAIFPDSAAPEAGSLELGEFVAGEIYIRFPKLTSETYSQLKKHRAEIRYKPDAPNRHAECMKARDPALVFAQQHDRSPDSVYEHQNDRKQA